MLEIPVTKLDDLDHKIIHEEFFRYWAQSVTYRAQMAEDEQFYLGNQHTTSQKDYLRSIGQSDQPNNKIKPSVEQVLANVASGNPQWHVRPRKMDNTTAFVLNRIFDDIWDDSEGGKQFRSTALDHVVKGKSHLFIYPDWHADNGQGALRILNIDPNCVFKSANTSDEALENSPSTIYSDIHVKKVLISMYPEFADKIKDAKDSVDIEQLTFSMASRDNVTVRGQNIDQSEERIRKYVRFAPVNVAYAKITNMETGAWKLLDDKEYAEAVKDQEYNKLVEIGVINEEIVYKSHQRETFYIGDQEIYDEVLPITECPLKSACNNWTRNPEPSGDVRHAKGPQRKLNRTEALLIAHTTATAGVNVGYEEGAIDASEMIKMSLPGRIAIKFNPGGLSNKKYHEFGVNQVNTELFHEKARYVQDIEAVFGAYGWQQGDSGQAPGTVGEAQIMDEASARKQNYKMLPLYDMLNGIARVAVQWIPHVYDQQRLYKLIHPNGKEEEVTLNGYYRDKSGAIQKLYDMTSIDAEVRVVVGSARAQSPLAKLNKDLMLLNAGIYDTVQVILNMEENVDKVALLERMDERKQLQRALEAQGEELKKVKGDLQTRERESYHDKMQLQVSKGGTELKSAVKGAKAQIDTEKKYAIQSVGLTSKEKPQA